MGMLMGVSSGTSLMSHGSPSGHSIVQTASAGKPPPAEPSKKFPALPVRAARVPASGLPAVAPACLTPTNSVTQKGRAKRAGHQGTGIHLSRTREGEHALGTILPISTTRQVSLEPLNRPPW